MTAISTLADRMNAISTPRIATLCAPRRPTVLPNRPAMIAPTSGASATHSSVDWEMLEAASDMSALERVELVDVDRRAVAEQHHEDRQADRRLGRGDGEDEEDEHLACHVAEIVREGDEV